MTLLIYLLMLKAFDMINFWSVSLGVIVWLIHIAFYDRDSDGRDGIL